MKKFAKIGLILAIIALVVACSKESSDTLAEDKINMDLINAVGIPAKIYSAQNTSARYITGEIIEEGDKKYRFQGNLVEYSFVNPIILNAFDEVPTSSLIHQEYNDVSYDSSKAYIEVCYYEDVESGEKIAYELRLIDDSYFNHSYSNWHAKEIEFGNEDLEEIKFFKKTKTLFLEEGC